MHCICREYLHVQQQLLPSTPAFTGCTLDVLASMTIVVNTHREKRKAARVRANLGAL
jgi:hypothetical protein